MAISILRDFRNCSSGDLYSALPSLVTHRDNPNIMTEHLSQIISVASVSQPHHAKSHRQRTRHQKARGLARIYYLNGMDNSAHLISETAHYDNQLRKSMLCTKQRLPFVNILSLKHDTWSPVKFTSFIYTQFFHFITFFKDMKTKPVFIPITSI